MEESKPTPPETITVSVEWKDPDLLYVSKNHKWLEKFADCGECFEAELEVTRDGKIVGGKFVKRK